MVAFATILLPRISSPVRVYPCSMSYQNYNNIDHLKLLNSETLRGDWGPLGHFSYFVKYLDFEKQYACVTYHNLLTIHSAT